MRGVVAVLGGLLVFSLAAMALIVVSGRPPERWPGAQFAAFSITYGGVFAALAGYTTARLAPRAPLAHAIAFAVLLLLTSFFSYSIQQAGGSPWSLISTVLVSCPAAILGGYLRHKTQRA